MSAVFPLASAFSLAAVWGKQEHAFPRLPQHALNSKLNKWLYHDSRRICIQGGVLSNKKNFLPKALLHNS